MDSVPFFIRKESPSRFDTAAIVGMPVERYARILSPAVRRTPEGELEVPWHTVATYNRRVVHPGVAWEMISGYGESMSQPELWDAPPQPGHLPISVARALMEILHIRFPRESEVWGGIYESELNISPSQIAAAIGNSPGHEQLEYTSEELEKRLDNIKNSAFEDRLRDLPPQHCITSEKFDYLGLPMRLLRGTLEELTKSDGGPRRRPSNLIWSISHGWCIAAHADLPSVYVGGSNELIDDVLNRSDLESFEVSGTQDVTWESDTVNPLPD